MMKKRPLSLGWFMAWLLAGAAIIISHGAVAADSPVQDVPVPISRWMVLNPATNKLYLDSYAGGSFLTVLNGTTYATKTLRYPGGWFVDAAVDPIHNRIYILPGSYLSNDPILVVNGATDTWTTSIPIPDDTNRRENYQIAVDAENRFLYFAEETTSSHVLVHQINAVSRATTGSMDVTTGGVVDLAYNPANGMVYLLTAHFVSGSWDHNTVWVLDVAEDAVLRSEAIDVQYAKLVVNETTGDVYVGTTALDGDRHTVLTRSLPAQARGVNPYTNKVYCFNNGGTLYEVDGAQFTSTALRDFANIDPTYQGDAIAINPALNKLYLFSDQYGSSYMYDPTRDLRQTLPDGMTRWAAVNSHNHRLYLAPSRTQVSIYGGAPTLNVSRVALTFVAVQDGADPPTQGFIVRMNSGDRGNLRYTVVSDAPWLAVNKSGRFLEWYPISTTLEAQVQVRVDINGLAPGDHTGHLTIASEGANSSPRTVTVNLVVGDGASPLMRVDAGNPVRFEAMEGDPAPALHGMNVRNLGAGSLTYTVVEDIPWLDVVGNASGSVSANVVHPITLAINSAYTALEPGTYSAPLTVTSDSLGSPQTVNVELLIYPRARLALSTRTMPFNAFVETGDPAMRHLFVNNDGGGVVDWTATRSGAWLRTSGALSGRAPGAFRVGADIAGLDLGIHTGYINVVAGTSVEDSPQSVDVTLNVDTARRMALSKLRLDDFAFVEGTTPDAQSFRIYNAGAGGAFNWGAETDATWLTLSATSGTADESGAMVQVSVNPAQLSVGEHRATITVRGEQVKGAVQTIRVTAFVASASAPNCLPDVHLDVVKTSLASIAVDIVSVDAYHGAACDVTADVDLHFYGLSNFNRTYHVQGSISDANALLLPIADTLDLTLAKVGLKLSNVEIGNAALTAQGQWDFGPLLGQTRSAGQVTLGRNGLKFDGSTTFPINQSWSFEGFSFSADQGTVHAAQSFNELTLEVDGELTIKIFGSRDVKIDVTLEVSRYGKVRVKGSLGEVPLPNFNFTLAGFTVQTKDVRFIDGKVEIARAEIKTPANWGGLGTDIYAITIDGNGKVSVGGGKLRLPALKAGGLNLMSLEGVLREVTGGYGTNGLLQPTADGYEITAGGEFGVPGMGSSGACAINVEVTIYVNERGMNVLELAPLETPTPLGANAVDGIALREATLGLHCLPGVPLGNTGFFITGVEGIITLHDRIESVSVKMWIEHGTRIGSASLVSMDPRLTLYFSPFAIDFNAGLRLVGIKIAETGVHIDKNNFSTYISYDFLIVHGYTSFAAGTHNGKAYIAGSGKTTIGLTKGCILKKCALGICVKIPPMNLNLGSVGIDFGTFKNGKFGVKGTINVLGLWRGGAFVGFDGTIKFGSLKDYQLIGSHMVRQARAAHLQMAQGMAPQTVFDPDLSFAPNGDTLVRVSIPELSATDTPQTTAATALFPTSVISTVNVLRGDVIFALAQPPDGELAFTLVAPNGTEYTPDYLHSSMDYVQAVDGEGIQSMYTVQSASTGDWQVRITGDTDNTAFLLSVTGNTPQPATLGLIDATGPTTATVAWIAQVAVTDTKTASLYARSGPLTRTVTFTDSEGLLVTETEDIYEGILISDALTTTMDVTAYEQTFDLAMLPSGDYALWLEVDDGENLSSRWYLREGLFGDIERVIVDHSATFPTNWTAALTPTLESIQSGDMRVSWRAGAHPDALTYTLHVATPGALTPTLLTTRRFTVSDAIYGSVEAVRVDNVLPGQPYTFTLAAHNQQDGRVAWSQAVTLLTPQPDFIIIPTTPITVASGHTTPLTLTLLIPDDLPFPLTLAPGYSAAPDGFTLDFTPSIITTTGTVEAVVHLSAVPQMVTGTYAMPVIAQSGALVRGAVLDVTVVEAHYPVYLPLVMR
ncbi:MAG: hypothetical protein JXA21_20905 [Anaerolineae bacterium]|nr:hypothetical protein [Anaerolineae bacterium]